MRIRVVIFVMGFFMLLGCGGKIKRTFDDPQPVGENSIVKLQVHKIYYKKKGKQVLRVWATLINKTDKNLTCDYGSFKIIVNGKVYPGALRVPFVRVTKAFPVSANMTKKIPGPVEALHVQMAAEATLKLENIQVEGESNKISVSVNFPFVPAGDE